MGWAAKERTGRPAGGAGQHPQGRNAEEVSAARALRPGAAGLEGSVAHPTDGESYKQCDRAGAALARSPQLDDPQSAWRIGRTARQRRPAMLIVTRQGRDPSGARSERSEDRAAVPQGGANPNLAISHFID